MNEQKLLNDIFGWPMWQNKHKIDYCPECDTAILIYSCCKNTTCSCGGCEKCKNDPIVDEFDKSKTQVKDYLTTEDYNIYYKGQRLKTYILDSLDKGEPEINWEDRLINGQISENDLNLFQDLIKKSLGDKYEECILEFKKKWAIGE